MLNFRNIFNRKNRILLAELVRTDFKIRYESSALGYVWSVLNPLMIFAVLYLVFTVFLGVGRNIEHYPMYLLTGVVLWRFFTEATNSGLKAIVDRGSLIRKINFPKYIIIISGTISSLINLGISMVVVILFCVVNGVHFTPAAFLIIPLILQLYLLALGFSFFLSAINVYLRDIGYIWEVFMQAAFYCIPIIYPITLVVKENVTAAKILMLNPVAQIIQDARHALVTHDSITTNQLFEGGYYMFIPYILTVIVVISGAVFFKKKSANFAEHV